MRRFLVCLCLCLLCVLPLYSSVFYEIFVSSFYDSDGDRAGDLRGVEQKLSYIRDELGADGIWLMPIMQSPSYHRYDVTDYYNVDPSLGTLEDFVSLCAACHERGMRIIIDLPVNHTSDRHPWFTDGEHNSWYNWSNTVQSGYTAKDGRYYESRFNSTMPDLNLDNPAVRAEIENIISFWMGLGADGFRLDATTYYYFGSNAKNIEFLSFLSDCVKSIDPSGYIVAEAWTDGVTISSFYASGVDSFFNFPCAQATGTFIKAVKKGSGKDIVSALTNWYSQIGPSATDAPFLSNHDMARSASALITEENIKKAASVYLLLPGNPFIYYGEEIGMAGGARSDEDKRCAFQWSSDTYFGECDSPVYATDIRILEEGQAEQAQNGDSVFSHYSSVLKARKCSPLFDDPAAVFEAFDTGFDSVMAFTLASESGRILVMHNLGSSSAAFYLGEGSALACVSEGVLINGFVFLQSGASLILSI